MAYTNKATEIAVVIIVVLFLGITNQAQSIQGLDTPCALAIPEIVKHCYLKMNVSSPSEECCEDLKTANEREVTCLCNNIIANPNNSNSTQAVYDKVNIACDVVDKFACNGGDTNKNDTGTSQSGYGKGRSSNENAAAISLFGLVATLVLLFL